jgi:hypothetical protein
MTADIATVDHEFVAYIPEELAPAVVYVSLQYKVATHLCCCGCGERVVTPLNPAQWSVTYDGQTISLNHSIAGGSCGSHYFIRRGKVCWAAAMSQRQLALAAQRDQDAIHGRPTSVLDDVAADDVDEARPRWWRKLRRRRSGK